MNLENFQKLKAGDRVALRKVERARLSAFQLMTKHKGRLEITFVQRDSSEPNRAMFEDDGGVRQIVDRRDIGPLQEKWETGDIGWITVPNDSAAFDDLPAGEYRVEVLICEPDGTFMVSIDEEGQWVSKNELRREM